MKKLQFSVTINVPVERVWNVMLNQETYKKRAAEFYEGSYYKGSRDKGAKIHFLDPDGNGMFSEVIESIPYEFISLKHLGEIKYGEEDTDSEDAKMRVSAYENYEFSENNGVTTLVVTMDSPNYDVKKGDISDFDFEAMFRKIRPKALKKLKELCENSSL